MPVTGCLEKKVYFFCKSTVSNMKSGRLTDRIKPWNCVDNTVVFIDHCIFWLDWPEFNSASETQFTDDSPNIIIGKYDGVMKQVSQHLVAVPEPITVSSLAGNRFNLLVDPKNSFALISILCEENQLTLGVDLGEDKSKVLWAKTRPIDGLWDWQEFALHCGKVVNVGMRQIHFLHYQTGEGGVLNLGDHLLRNGSWASLRTVKLAFNSNKVAIMVQKSGIVVDVEAEAISLAFECDRSHPVHLAMTESKLLAFLPFAYLVIWSLEDGRQTTTDLMAMEPMGYLTAVKLLAQESIL
jgi:hypothetical protein